ncbi:hypothetical protein DIE23_27165 [Burkholderia sp. Bp9143]|nr:hypothetical protein DIE23_27165 [Burkholderia sp. Bp9143]
MCGLHARPGVACVIGTARRGPIPGGWRPANGGIARHGRAVSAHRRRRPGVTPDRLHVTARDSPRRRDAGADASHAACARRHPVQNV